MSKPFHIGVMDTVDAILLLLPLRRATPNSPRTTDRCAAAADQGRRRAVPVLSLFSFPMFLGQETQERGRSHFYPPKSVSRARRLRQIAARRRTRCGSWRGEFLPGIQWRGGRQLLHFSIPPPPPTATTTANQACGQQRSGHAGGVHHATKTLL